MLEKSLTEIRRCAPDGGARPMECKSVLIKLRFNKPAIDRFFTTSDGVSRLASHILCELESNNIFWFRPFWLESEEGSEYHPLNYSIRGSANVELKGKFAESALKSLQNIYNNPFFVLETNDLGNIVSKPYMPLSAGRVSSPRLDPIMRVFVIDDWSHGPPLRASTSDVDLALSRVIDAHAIIKRKNKHGLTHEDIDDAREILAKFERVARVVLPIFADIEMLTARYGSR